MLIRSDMIRRQIGENTVVEGEAVHTVEHQALGGNFHNDTVTAGIDHITEILLNQIGFRRSVVGFDDFFSDNGFNRTDQSGFEAGFFQNRAHHIGGGCFSFCTGNTNCF